MLNIYIIVSLVLFAFVVYRGLTYSAGDEGEKAVARRLRRLSEDRYFTINDLMFEKRSGYTTQIDHVVVSPYGIFVIETKNISGYVYGAISINILPSFATCLPSINTSVTCTNFKSSINTISAH